MSSHDVKRKKPFLGVRQYVDEDDYEERADRFIEYHEEIVDEDQSEWDGVHLETPLTST